MQFLFSMVLWFLLTLRKVSCMCAIVCIKIIPFRVVRVCGT